MLRLGLADITNASFGQTPRPTPSKSRPKAKRNLGLDMDPWSPSPIPRTVSATPRPAPAAAGQAVAEPLAIREGVVATVGGRLAQVVAQDKDVWVRVRWADDGTETLDWLHVDKLSTVVASADRLTSASVLAPAITASLVSINALKAPLGDGGLAALVAALKGTSVQSICGLSEGQQAADFSGQGLRPADAAVIAAELRLPRRAAALTSLDVSDNDLLGNCFTFGIKLSSGGAQVVDSDQSGWNELCDALKASTALTEFRCANVGMGPAGCGKLTVSLPTQLGSLTLSSTGDARRGPKMYTLATTTSSDSAPPAVCVGTFAQTPDGRLGEVIAQENDVWVRLRWVDSGSYLGIVTAPETADWLSTDQLSEHLFQSDVPIVEGSMATHKGRLGTVIAMENGAWVRLQWVDDSSETLDWISTDELTPFTHSVFANKSYRLSTLGLGDADARLLTGWLGKPEVSAAVTDVDVSGNPLAKNQATVAALSAAMPPNATLRGVAMMSHGAVGGIGMGIGMGIGGGRGGGGGSRAAAFSEP